MNKSRAFTLLAAFAFGATAPSHSLAGTADGPRIVAKVGGPVPSIPGATFTGFDQPVINDNGFIAFRASFTGGGATAANDEGLFLGPPTGVDLAVREGETNVDVLAADLVVVPTGGGLVLVSVSDLFFGGVLSGPTVNSTNDRGVFVSQTPGADVKILVREGDPIGGTGLTIDGNGLEPGNVIPGILANSGGHAALTAVVTDGMPGIQQYGLIYANTDDVETLVGVTGGFAPGGGTFEGAFPGQNPFEVVSVDPQGLVTFRGTGIRDGEPFEALFLYDPATDARVRIAGTGDKASGAKPGRFLSGIDAVSGTGGGLSIFSSVLQKGDNPPDFSEIGLFQTTGIPGKAKLVALRDRSAKGTGGVFADFPSCLINQTGCVAFGTFLFKRPNGFPAGQDQAIFGGPGNPRLIAQTGRPVPGLPDTTCTAFDLFGLSITNGNQVLIPATVAPGDDALLVSTFTGNGKPTTRILLQDGLIVGIGTGTDTINAFDLPNGQSKGSDGKPRSVNALGQGVFEVVFGTNGNSIYFSGTPKLPDVLQPDIILSTVAAEGGTVGDNVHQEKADDPQKVEREQPVNMRMDYTFFIQNDGTVNDTVRFTSSGSDARDRLKWYRGDDDTMEISDAVFGNGQEFLLMPGERVKVRLAAERQTLENKGKTDKVKMKAVSTADKQFRDAFQITIKFTPVP